MPAAHGGEHRIAWMVSVPPLRDGRRTRPSAAGGAQARFDIGVVSAGSATPLEVGLHGLSLSQPLVGPGDHAIPARAVRNSACGQPSLALLGRNSFSSFRQTHCDPTDRRLQQNERYGRRRARHGQGLTRGRVGTTRDECFCRADQIRRAIALATKDSSARTASVWRGTIASYQSSRTPAPTG